MIRQARAILMSVLLATIGLAVVLPAWAAAGPEVTPASVTTVGTGTLSSGVDGAEVPEGSSSELRVGPAVDQQLPHSATIHHVDASGTPRPQGLPVTVDTLPSGFNGISHRDQRLAGGANTQFSLEPPDQGLCVGNGSVLETVNDAVRVFTTAGTPVAATKPMNAFLGLAPEVIRSSPPVFGPFVSDPKCYFDPDTNRWFLTVTELDENPSSGAFTGGSHVFIAVSKTGNPAGSWTILSLDVADLGHANCPCLGDQPLIGADRNGFYVSTNEFGPIPSFSHFNGAQVYAFSKTELEAASSGSVTGVQINVGALATPDPGGIWFTLQPATSPNGVYALNTEYFLSSLDFSSDLDNRIAVWQLTNTQSLNSAVPALSLTHAVIGSEVYGQPPAAYQKPGEIPLGELVHSPLGLLNSNDDRMNQVVYAAGKLWSGVNTVVQTENGPTRSGIAYFVVSPAIAAGAFSPTIAAQGYVSVNQENVLFPSIGVNGSGMAVMSFTVTGPDVFPSAAFSRISLSGGAGMIHVSGAGQDPEDGFTAYRAFGGGGTARWGDYSAAVADLSGKVWLATEYIPKACASAPQAGCRTLFAKWGTFVTQVGA